MSVGGRQPDGLDWCHRGKTSDVQTIGNRIGVTLGGRENHRLIHRYITQQMIKQTEKFIERFRAKATKARQAQSRMKALAKMAVTDVPPDEHVAPIRIPEATPASPPLITMDRASVGYEAGKPILTNMSLRFDPEDRVALLGKNGNGKSTMAKLLAGKLQAMGGEFTPARKLVVGYFAQHQAEELDTSVTPIVTLQRMRPKPIR